MDWAHSYNWGDKNIFFLQTGTVAFCIILQQQQQQQQQQQHHHHQAYVKLITNFLCI
jgi:hypothetical protein